jgi:hypothetical protein
MNVGPVSVPDELAAEEHPERDRDPARSWPEMVGKRLPDAVFTVDRDRILDSAVARLAGHVVDIPLEAELGGVDADDRQAMGSVLGVPGAKIWQCPEPVDARIRPEIDEDDPTAKRARGQRLGIEPTGRAVEWGQAAFDGKRLVVVRKPVGDRPG